MSECGSSASCDSCSSRDCDACEAREDRSSPPALRGVAHKWVVLSGKGGVGKSTTAVNLALTLAREGFRVGVLDADLHGPSLPKMLGVEGRRAVGSPRGLAPLPVMGLGLVSVGLLMEDPDEALVWRGPLKATLLKQLVEETDWGDLDYLVVDCPPGTGDEPLSVLQCLGGADATLLVTTPQEVAAADVRKSIAFCGALKSGSLFLVENLSGFVCPHCGERVALFGAGAGERMAERYGIPLLAQIPYDPSLLAGGEQGRPAAAFLPESPVAETFRDLVAQVRTRTEDL